MSGGYMHLNAERGRHEMTAPETAREPRFAEVLSPAQLADLRARGRVRRFSCGSALFHERQVADHVALLLSGRVKLFRVTDDGREILLDVRGPGDLVGEQAAFDEQPRSASGAVLELVEALVVPYSAFGDFLRAAPEAMLFIARTLSCRLREADRKRVEFASQDVLGRVAVIVLELVARFGNEGDRGVRIDLPLTQPDLAGWAGASIESVTKALHTLRELHVLETGRRRLVVLDAERLRRLAA
jgi:CRP/FNR family transcriptional regulator, cyclic AMP receptor protein